MTPYRADLTAYGLVASLTFIWGGSFALIAICLRGFSPMVIASGRVCLAALALALVVKLSGQKLPKGWDQWKWCTALGVFSLGLPFTLIIWAQQSVASNVAAIFIAGVPVFTLGLSQWIFKDRITTSKWLGFLLGLAGLAVLAGPDVISQIGGTGQAWGQIACILATISFAIGGQVVRAMPPMPAIPATTACHIVAALVTLPFGLQHLPVEVPDATPIAALLVLGLIQTGLAQLLRYIAVRRAGPVFVSIVGYLIPIWAGVLGVVLLDETLTIQAVIACCLIIAGIFIARPGR